MPTGPDLDWSGAPSVPHLDRSGPHLDRSGPLRVLI